MASALEQYVEDRSAGGIDVPTTVDLLRRYAHLERGAIRALAGWLLKTPAYETKNRFAYELWGHAERVETLRARLHERPRGPTIVYVTRQKTAEDVASMIAATGLPAVPYHAGLSAEKRGHLQDTFMQSEAGIVVATIAFGSRCRHMMTALETPSARAAWMYSKLRPRRNSARTKPTSDTQENSSMIPSSVKKPGTSTADRINSR